MKKKYYSILLLLLVIYIFIYRFFIYTKFLRFNECLTSVFSLILLSLSIYFLGYRKTINNEESRKINKNTIISLILFFIVSYLSGFVTGFLKNSYSMNIFEIINNIFFLFITYSSIEIFRYVFISDNKNNKSLIVLLTFLLIIFDINLKIRVDTFNGLDNIFSFITTICLPSILNNILLTNIVLYSNNFKSSLLYRLIMELYIFVVPIVPDLNDYIKSIFLLLLPFCLLLSISKISVVKEEKKIKRITKLDIIIVCLILVFSMLIFGIGPFKMVGIETASMSPNFNVGDAVIINKYINKDELKEEDVIAYYDKDNRLIVHRIIKINNDNTYITKGDMNNTADSKYVNKDQIYGKVIFRIPYIAYPAVKLRER